VVPNRVLIFGYNHFGEREPAPAHGPSQPVKQPEAAKPRGSRDTPIDLK
jgi:hypothetical protein